MTPSITRPVGRVRIETQEHRETAERQSASPGRLAGCGLKLDQHQWDGDFSEHHPAGWPGAD